MKATPFIVFDTETTGLIGNDATPLDQQPEIIEFAACKVDGATFEVIDEIEFLCKPRKLPLPEKIMEITKITNEDLADKRSFAFHLDRVQQFFLGTQSLVAHNVAYDVGMLTLELRRLDMMAKFPWPPFHHCTVEISKAVKGHRLKLGNLYTMATGKSPKGAHRAINDVRMLVECFPWLAQEQLLW